MDDRGYGRLATEVEAARGARQAILDATDGGASVYQRLGFEGWDG
jgi:hypothetical protein